MPDLYVSCHYNDSEDIFGGYFELDFPYIYINLGDGTFSPIQYEVDPTGASDLHGAVFFDFDNDGFQDIFSSSGGNQGNLFFVNDQQTDFALNNRSVEFQIDQEFGRGRGATCLDIDNNGITDLLVHNLANNDGLSPPSIFTREAGEPFVNENTERNWDVPSSTCGTLADIDNNGKADLLVLADVLKLFSFETGIFEEIQSVNIQRVNDFVVEDFDGDLLPDIFLALGNERTDYAQIDALTLQTVLMDAPALDNTQFSFETADSIYINIYPRDGTFQTYTIHYGSSLVYEHTGPLNLALHPDDTDAQGIQTIEPGLQDHHLFIGTTSPGLWEVVSHNSTASSTVAVKVEAISAISNFQYTELVFNTNQVRDRILINQGDNNFQSVVYPFLTGADNSRNVVAADFDNDMDVDIYVQCSTSATNRPNYLLENTGNNEFVRHDAAWGATGNDSGIGDAATVVDYNNDGFLDIFTSNGFGVFYLEDAKYNLYENQGNQNNWVKFDLVGTESPRGAYGAVVHLYAGQIEQVRTKNAGEHYRSQNDERIHFGLAQNTTVDSLIIYWPCGSVQKLYNLDINQILTIEEQNCTINTSAAISGAKNWVVYPNPTDRYFQIKSSLIDIHKVEIINSLGQIISVFHQDELHCEGCGKFSIDHAGIYIVRLSNEQGGIIGHSKLIVN